MQAIHFPPDDSGVDRGRSHSSEGDWEFEFNVNDLPDAIFRPPAPGPVNPLENNHRPSDTEIIDLTDSSPIGRRSDPSTRTATRSTTRTDGLTSRDEAQRPQIGSSRAHHAIQLPDDDDDEIVFTGISMGPANPRNGPDQLRADRLLAYQEHLRQPPPPIPPSSFALPAPRRSSRLAGTSAPMPAPNPPAPSRGSTSRGRGTRSRGAHRGVRASRHDSPPLNFHSAWDDELVQLEFGGPRSFFGNLVRMSFGGEDRESSLFPSSKPPPQKQFKETMSHGPHLVEKGFTRHIVPPPEGTEWSSPSSPSSHSKGKGKAPESEPDIEVVQLVPECASCLLALALEGAGESRVWILRCGHVVCGKCIGNAKKRCEDVSKGERGGWVGHDSFVDDREQTESLVGPTRNTRRNKGKARQTAVGKGVDQSNKKDKGKGKAKDAQNSDGVRGDWTSCPVIHCDGAGTDLLAKDDEYAAWPGYF